MSELKLIWWFTLALATSSLSMMLLLVLRRVRDEYRTRHDRLLRAVIQDILFKYMDAEDEHSQDISRLLGLKGRVVQVLRQLAIDLCHLIQGHEQVRLAELLEKTGFKQQCISDLHHKDHRKRQSAATALELYADEQSRVALIGALDDEDSEVRITAANTLHVINALPSLTVLARKLEEKNLLRSRDVRSLFRDIARHSPDSLIELAAAPETSQPMLLVLADAMSESVDFSVLETLYRFAAHDNMDLRGAALRSLGTLHHPGAAAVVKNALNDPHWQVRAIAASAIAQIGLDDCVSSVNSLLDDTNWWVRFRAAEALYELGEEGRHFLALRAAGDGSNGSGDGAQIAALVLRESGNYASMSKR